MSAETLLRSELTQWPVRRGKVRDVYDLGDRLLIVATDRISAFDWILPTGIPGKGRLLTELSLFWFGRLHVRHHLLSTDVDSLLHGNAADAAPLRGRSMVVRKTQVVPIECVVRGYLAGSGWKEYQQSGSVCGVRLPPGLVESSQLPEPIFTPATKAESGHDENISFAQMVAAVGADVAEQLRDRSLAIYRSAAEYALTRGIIIADTKFEFGHEGSDLILIDEVLTPDSSRFWPQDQYQPGRGQPSFDKQYVRDWLESTGWDKQSPPPELPDEVVARTQSLYADALRRLTGN